MVRLKRRYALCEVIFPKKSQKITPEVTDTMIFNALKNALLHTHGDLGFASLKSSIKVSYANKDTNIFIIRGSRDHFDILSSSLMFVQKIDDYDVILNTLYVGGSIRCCQKFIIKYHKRNLPLLYPACATNDQREAIMQSIMEACEQMESSKSLDAQEES